jgi:protein-tyrosine-phosphatase
MDESRPFRLLFVCSGNVCRSPMAAAIADRVALELARDVEIRSAGTLGLEGHPAHGHVVSVCREIGLDVAAHRSQGLTEALVRWADRIFVMEPEHAVRVHELAPDLGEERVIGLGPYAGRPFVADPLGSWLRFVPTPFRATREELLVAIRAALAEALEPRR